MNLKFGRLTKLVSLEQRPLTWKFEKCFKILGLVVRPNVNIPIHASTKLSFLYLLFSILLDFEDQVHLANIKLSWLLEALAASRSDFSSKIVCILSLFIG